MKVFVLASVLGMTMASTSCSADSWFGDGGTPDSLRDAHEHHLAGDDAAAVKSIRRLFQEQPYETVAHQNALALLGKIEESQGKAGVPADVKLPDNIRYLEVIEGRRQTPDKLDYSVKIFGRGRPSSEVIRQVQLTRFDGEVVLDRDHGIGEWWTSPNPSENDEFEMGLWELPQPPQNGMYSIHIEFANSEPWDGWFLLSNALASASPAILEPTPGQVLTTARPTMRWDDFRSPEYRSFEERSVYGAVTDAATQTDAFTFWKDHPSMTEFATPSGKSLADGRYRFHVSYTETHKFGDLQIGRSAGSTRRFHVRAEH